MEVTGKLVAVMQEQTGTGKNGTWKKREFLIETSGQYPKKICIEAWGDKADSLDNYAIGQTLVASIDIESREYNNRWYTGVRAFKIEKIKEAEQPEVTTFTNDDEENQLPF